MVGIGIYFCQYAADRKNATAIKEVESNWMTGNAKLLLSKNTNHTPRCVLTRYCEAISCNEDTIMDLKMDWEFFAPNEEANED